jgi:phosphate-selective porin OprO/OprP
MLRSLRFKAGLVALIVALLAASVATAQVTGLYYQEVEKDGRIYIFNTPERYQSFQQTGDMGTAVTLLDRGPNGETLVAENETALDLYLFKHNLPGYERPTPKPATPDFTITYKDAKTTIEGKNARISFYNRFQGRYTLVQPEVGDDVGSFRIRRFHTIFEGTVYKVWKAKLQVNWTGTDTVTDVTQSGTTVSRSRIRGPVLDDAELQWAKYPLATVWAGQGKVFFGRQELTSDTRLQFVDRSIASERFSVKRDQGVALIGQNRTKLFEYQAGLYNGNGPNQATNDNKQYGTVQRFVLTPLGEFPLAESSLDYPETPRLAIGGEVWQNTLGTGTSERDVTRYGAELAFKLKGFNAFGEYYTETVDPVAGADIDTDGYYAQAGFLFPNKLFEIAGRYSVVSPDVAGPSQDQTETGVAASWYWEKHNHKIQADYRILEDERLDREDKEFRLQLQLVF